MLFIKTSFHKVSALFIIFLISLNFNSVWANNFISRGYYVIDLSQKLEWLTCPVGMVWDNKTCVGNPVKLKFNEIESAIFLANEQLKGRWRLPKREELEKIICIECKNVKINKKIFPNTPPESFWTSEKNPWRPKLKWTVNFYTGYALGRFPGFIPKYVRRVRDK